MRGVPGGGRRRWLPMAVLALLAAGCGSGGAVTAAGTPSSPVAASPPSSAGSAAPAAPEVATVTPTGTPPVPRPTASPAAVRTGPPPARRPVVVIDPGHNGGNIGHLGQVTRLVDAGNGDRKPCNEIGAQTATGYAEHAFTWDVAARLRSLLAARGVDVRLTRSSDRGVGPCVDVRGRFGNVVQGGRGRLGARRRRTGQRDRLPRHRGGPAGRRQGGQHRARAGRAEGDARRQRPAVRDLHRRRRRARRPRRPGRADAVRPADGDGRGRQHGQPRRRGAADLARPGGSGSRPRWPPASLPSWRSASTIGVPARSTSDGPDPLRRPRRRPPPRLRRPRSGAAVVRRGAGRHRPGPGAVRARSRRHRQVHAAGRAAPPRGAGSGGRRCCCTAGTSAAPSRTSRARSPRCRTARGRCCWSTGTSCSPGWTGGSASTCCRRCRPTRWSCWPAGSRRTPAGRPTRAGGSCCAGSTWPCCRRRRASSCSPGSAYPRTSATGSPRSAAATRSPSPCSPRPAPAVRCRPGSTSCRSWSPSCAGCWSARCRTPTTAPGWPPARTRTGPPRTCSPPPSARGRRRCGPGWRRGRSSAAPATGSTRTTWSGTSSTPSSPSATRTRTWPCTARSASTRWAGCSTRRRCPGTGTRSS